MAVALVSPPASLISSLASLGGGGAKATSCTPESTAASSEKCDETGAARTCARKGAVVSTCTPMSTGELAEV